MRRNRKNMPEGRQENIHRMNENNNNPKPNPNKKLGIIGLIAAVVIFLFFSFFMNLVRQSTNREITYNEFMEMVEQGEVVSVSLTDSRIVVVPKKQESPLYSISYYTGYVGDQEMVAKLLAAGVTVNARYRIPEPVFYNFFWFIFCRLLGFGS